MTQHDGARLVGCFTGDPARKYLADSTQAHMSESIMTVINGNHLAILGPRSFADYYHSIARFVRQRSVQSRFANPPGQKIEDFLVMKRMFGYEDDVRLAGDTGP